MTTKKEPPQLKAFCSSRRCYGKDASRYGTIKENAPKGARTCPDCGQILFWTVARKNGRAAFSRWPEKKLDS